MTLPLTELEYQSIRSLYKSTKDKRIATYLNIVLLKHKLYSQIEIADILNILNGKWFLDNKYLPLH